MKNWQWALFLSCAFYVSCVNFSQLQAQTVLTQDIDMSTLSEEEIAEAKQRLKRKRDCERYIDISKNADFTQKELEENIIIQFGDESVNCWTFVKNEEARIKQDQQAKEKAKKKIYITVKDITEDLLEQESDQVKRLRNRLNFTGDNE